MADNFDDISTAREETSYVIDTDKEYEPQTKETNIGQFHPSYAETEMKEVSPLRKHFKVVIGLTLVIIWFTVVNVLQARNIIPPLVGLLLSFIPLIVVLIVVSYFKNRQLR